MIEFQNQIYFGLKSRLTAFWHKKSLAMIPVQHVYMNTVLRLGYEALFIAVDEAALHLLPAYAFYSGKFDHKICFIELNGQLISYPAFTAYGSTCYVERALQGSRMILIIAYSYLV